MNKSELQDLINDFRSLPWEIGDAINTLTDEMGERAHGYCTDTGLSDAQLYDLARVAALWAPAERIYDLPWSYYRDAGSDKGIAKRLLDSTYKMGWSREQMRKALKKIRELDALSMEGAGA